MKPSSFSSVLILIAFVSLLPMPAIVCQTVVAETRGQSHPARPNLALFGSDKRLEATPAPGKGFRKNRLP